MSRHEPSTGALEAPLGPDAWPKEIRLLKGRRAVRLTFDTGAVRDLSAELLRVYTPSAERKGHRAGEEKVIGGKRDVAIRSIDPVGQYAVRIGFSDGHGTGLYTFAALSEMAGNADARWRAYEAALAEAGLDRDRAGEAPWPVKGDRGGG